MTPDAYLQGRSFEGAGVHEVRYEAVEEFGPGLILLNNDLTDGPKAGVKAFGSPVVPVQEIGWWNRSKGEFFSILEKKSVELAELLGVEPWRIFPETRHVPEVDLEGDIGKIVDAASQVFEIMEARQIEPSRRDVFVKDDRGTYGQATTSFRSLDELRDISRARRRSLKTGKGGHDVRSVTVQEGIPTRFRYEGVPAEPVHTVVDGGSAGYF